jgi:hypothetical protein
VLSVAPSLDTAVIVALCTLARALGYPWSDTVDLRAAEVFALDRTTVEQLSIGGTLTESFRVTVRHEGREWVRAGFDLLGMLAQLAFAIGTDLGTLRQYRGGVAALALADDTEHASAFLDNIEDPQGHPGEPMVSVDLYTGDEPDPDAEHGVEVELLPLIAHPRADRRALVAAEVRVMLRDLACASVAAALGGRVGDRERWEQAYAEVLRLMEAGRVGDAHSVASAALYPVGASVGVSSVGQVRT